MILQVAEKEGAMRGLHPDDQLNFHEDHSFDGDVDMCRIMKILIQEDETC